MAYTTTQLSTFFTNANAGTAPSAAQTLTLTALANQNAAGTLTDAQALAQTIDLAADITTSVAIETYAFFTGTAPSQAGIAYLNTAFVGTGAQAGLNGENRFIAQSVALALGNTAAKTAFSASYGSLSVADATKAAYNIIIGNAAAAAAGINVDSAVGFLTSATSVAYYTSYVKANLPATTSAADLDLAVKAAIVGEIMYLATTYNNGAGVGSYATATTNLLKDLADDGNLTANSAGGINLLGSYGSSSTGNGSTGTPGSTVALTSTVDSLNGTVNDDTFNAVVLSGGTANADLKTTLSALDTINGGAGVDTLNITVSDNTNPAVAQGAVTIPGAAVSNVENIYVRTLSSAAADVTTIAAGSFSGATQFISDRSTNVVTVTGLAAGQAVGLSGTVGNAANLTGAYSTATASTINLLNGVSAATTAPTITITSGGALASSTINSTGSANTVGAVSLAGANTVSSITINAGAGLTTGAVTGFGAANPNTTAAITVNGGSSVTLGGITGGGANITTLNITTGSGTLTTGSITGAFTNNATVNVSGAAATTTANTASVTLGTLDAAVKTLNASGLTAGGVNVTIGGNTATVFTGGAGTDIVTIGAAQGAGLTGAINAGAGTDILAVTTGADLAANLTNLVTGFETLRVTAATNQTFDPTLINGITAYQVTAGAGVATLTNLLANANVTALSGTVTGVVLNLKDASGAADQVTLTLNNGATGSTTAGTIVSSVAMGGSASAGQVETLNIVSSGRVAAYNQVTLAASGGAPNYADANKVVVTGTQGLTLTTGITGHSISIDGSAAGPLNIVATAAVTGTATIIGGASNDSISVGTNVANIYAGLGGDTITMGNNAQTLVYKAAAESLLDLTGTAGASLAGATVNAGKMDVVTGFVTGTDKIDISNLSVNGALTAGVVDKGTVATDAALTTLLNTAGLFSDGISTRGLAQVHVNGGADTYVIVDVNKNGVFDASADLVIKLVGTASVAAGDFVTTN